MKRECAEFERILEDYFDAVLSDYPMFATNAGLKTGEGKLGRANLEFEARQERRRKRTLSALNKISPLDLTSEQHLDRLALRSRLLHECEDYGRGRHRMDPSGIEQVLNILLHELIRGGDSSDVDSGATALTEKRASKGGGLAKAVQKSDESSRAARNIRSLLERIPDFLAEAATMVDRPDPVWRRIMIQTAEGAPALFRAVAEFLHRHRALSTDSTRIAAAQNAVANYRDAILDRALAAEGSFAVGHDILQRRVRDELGLEYTLGEIEALAEAEVARISGLLAAECRKFGRNRTPEKILADARRQWSPKEELIVVYRSETERISRAFQEAGAVSFPEGDALEVKPVPEFMRSLFPTAAYTSPGAFEKRQRGIFWINDLSLTKSTAEEKHAERAQHFGIGLTCAHEAYPGHHLQFVTSNRHPRRWRRLFAHAVFYEGWTLWCEQMAVDLKVERSPWLRVQQLHDALWRCHRILVDLRLQTQRYSYERAVRHLQKNLGFTRARAEADVNWYTGQPGVPMSYWLGRLENERLRRRLLEGRNWSLQQFNDWLLSFGTLPQSWIEKYGLQ